MVQIKNFKQKGQLLMAHISFDSSNVTDFVHENELAEIQPLVTAADQNL